VHHEPHKGITVQIGEGQVIANRLSLPVVCDFRSQDVRLGGQGAPLVPIGDRDLYARFDGCINIGGFANISFTQNNHTLAFDICPTNVVLNPLAQQLGKPYDAEGKLAESGQVIKELLTQLNQIGYYRDPWPKSLGVEFLGTHIWPLIHSNYEVVDVLRTCTTHMAYQIREVVKALGLKKVLVSGGGALNQFLLAEAQQDGVDLRIASDVHLHFKEAFVFAYLGYLKMNHKINVLCSVTGATKNHSSGVVFYPKSH
jgi:anhydro-N-acetylmuramic acid kinase